MDTPNNSGSGVDDATLDVIIDYAVTILKFLPKAYGIDHMEKTLEFAGKVGASEQVDRHLCLVSAALHDIGLAVKCDFEHETIDDNHGVCSAEIAGKYLRGIGMKKDEIDIVCRSVSEHCFPEIQTTIYGRILWDCDKLNLFDDKMEKIYLRYWIEKGMTEENAEERIGRAREYYKKTFYTEYARNTAYEYLEKKAMRTIT
jgi:HD superfamily phosphodiesterase